jgi:hypothetical protein
MKELSPQLLRLLDVTRHADGPGARERERSHARLASMLAAGSAIATVAVAKGVVAATAPVAIATTAKAGTVATTAAIASAAGTAASTTGLSGTLAAAVPVVAAKFPLGQLLVGMALGFGLGTAGIVTTVAPGPHEGLKSLTALFTGAPASSGQRLSGHAPHLPLPRETRPEAPPAVDSSALGLEASRLDLSPGAAPVALVANSNSIRSTASPTESHGVDRAVASLAQVSTLADETRLLRAAQTARRRGDEVLALELLSEHARRFPDGFLKVERSVVEVLSLCAQGRIEASNRLREQILRQAPHLPAVARIREPCVVDPVTSK